MKRILALLASIALLGISAPAQTASTPESWPKVMFLQKGPGAPSPEIDFFFAEMVGGGELIRGAPYTATALTEATQELADGNRIVNRRAGLVARDSEGRTRREETMGRIGPLQVEGPKVIFIDDPVVKSEYVLNPETQVARVLNHEGARMMKLEEGRRFRVEIAKGTAPEGKREGLGEVQRESLPNEVIEGVNCEGVRETRTIPAGTIGNERALVITSETWVSPELHVAVLRKRNDPRFGETVYRLTDIKRGEPDASLFRIPTGYKTEKGPPPLPPPPPPVTE